MEYKNSKKDILFPLIVAVAVVAGILLGMTLVRTSRLSYTNALGDIRVQGGPQDKLSTVLNLIRSDYVDEPDMDTLAEEFIPRILERLDPHSVYIPARELAEVNEPLEGEFDGIGVMFNMLTDTVQVINVIPGGPSDKAGVLGGDRIITVNDSVIAGVKMDQDKVVKMLRGKSGTRVTLGIQRLGVRELTRIEVVRGKIPVKSLDAAFMIAPGIGYVKLSRFARTSHEEFVRAVEGLKAQGMKKLLFDLKGNVGGFLDQAILIANEFLPANTLIIYTEGRTRGNIRQYSDGKGRYRDLDLTLLIDEGSASSSEIVAGALQDNDRGLLVGRRSYGKGLVQDQIPLPDGSALRLTVARYHTPTGRCIQRPYDQGIEAYNNDFINRYEHSELVSADSIRQADSLRYTTPKGKVVYGGGGIMPDVFVPMDTTRLNDYLRNLIGRNLIFRYAMNYTDAHRAELNRLETLDQVKAYLDAHTPELVEGAVRYAASRSVTPKGKEAEESKAVLAAQLRAYVGRNTKLDDNAFYYFIAPLDEIVTEAVRRAQATGGQAPDKK